MELDVFKFTCHFLIVYFSFRTDVEEVTIDSTGSWKPVSIKSEKSDELDSCSGGPPPKRLKSEPGSTPLSNVASPMSTGNPTTPNAYKPPTPSQQSNRMTPNQQGPKTPQSNLMNKSTPSPASSLPGSSVSSQPQLVRQQSSSVSTPAGCADSCHLGVQGEWQKFKRESKI